MRELCPSRIWTKPNRAAPPHPTSTIRLSYIGYLALYVTTGYSHSASAFTLQPAAQLNLNLGLCTTALRFTISIYSTALKPNSPSDKSSQGQVNQLPAALAAWTIAISLLLLKFSSCQDANVNQPSPVQSQPLQRAEQNTNYIIL